MDEDSIMRRRDYDYWMWQQVGSDKSDADFNLGGCLRILMVCLAVAVLIGAISQGGATAALAVVFFLIGLFSGLGERHKD